MPGDVLGHGDDFTQTVAVARAHVHGGAHGGGGVEQAAVGIGHGTHVRKIAPHVQVAQFDALGAAFEVRHDFGQQKVCRLAYAGVVEGAHDGQRQPVGPQPRHVLHGQFAHGIVVGGLGRCGLVQHAFGLVAVDVGAAGQQHARRGLRQGRQRRQQVARAQQVNAVKRIGIAMANKGDGSQVDDGMGAHLRHGLGQRSAVEQVGLQVVRGAGMGRGRLHAQAPHLPAALLQGRLHVVPGKAVQPGNEYAPGGGGAGAVVVLGGHGQNEKPARLRRKSASTIIWHSCSSVVCGAQPSTFLALVGLPISKSTSAGR